MKTSKKPLLLLALACVSPLAFAGGPASNLPINAQLHQEARAIHALTQKIEHGAPAAKMTPRVQRLDFALQNTAGQMHVKASFAHDANALMTKTTPLQGVTRAELLGNLKVAQQWVAGEIERVKLGAKAK